MIYVTIGTLDYGFERLMKGLELLPSDLRLHMVAQIGKNRSPHGVKTMPFCSRAESMNYIKEADLIITHGGSTVMEALMEGKRIVAVPRMRKFGEAINDHQVDLCVKLSERDLLFTVLDMADLERSIRKALGSKPQKLEVGRLPFEVSGILDEINEEVGK